MATLDERLRAAAEQATQRRSKRVIIPPAGCKHGELVREGCCGNTWRCQNPACGDGMGKLRTGNYCRTECKHFQLPSE